MKPEDQYFRYVRWSGEDEAFVGYCPDLFRGGVCHGDNAVEVFADLCRHVREEVEDLQDEGRQLPPISPTFVAPLAA